MALSLIASLLLNLPHIMTGASIQHADNVRTDPRMVNGIPISAHEYPWVATLRSFSWLRGTTFYAGDSSFCTGSLISVTPPVVLTAAHCLQDYTYNASTDIISQYYEQYNLWFDQYLYVNINRTANDEVTVNATNFPEPDDYIQHLKDDDTYLQLEVNDIAVIQIHEGWSNLRNDIALLIFKNQTIDFPEEQLPALPAELDTDEVCCTPGDLFTAIGYGKDGVPGNFTPTLEMATLEYMNRTQCMQQYAASIVDIITSQMAEELVLGINCSADEPVPVDLLADGLQQYSVSLVTSGIAELEYYDICVAGTSGSTVCKGDSGGPLIRSMDNGQVEVIGVVSRGASADCPVGEPEIYTSVAHYKEWIYETIERVAYNESVEFSTTDIGTTDELTSTAAAKTSDDGESQDDSWFIVAIVFICLFGVAFIATVILGVLLLRSNKVGDGGQRQKAGYQTTNAQDVEME